MTIASNQADNLWQRVLDAHHQYAKAMNEFLVTPADKIGVLRQALRGKDRSLALKLIHTLSIQEKMGMLPEWVHLARSVHGPYELAWNVIQALPRDWVLQHIEKEVDGILQSEVEDDYWMFLQLYSRLDSALLEKLARRASNRVDPDIRELGEDYLANPPASANKA